ncbi:putative Methyltransferase FkbM domain-containing protein 2 [Homarus americanus]|uniref:Putative Methyltransferase FkbM domain-containing protein 2 n=1 Tax=Homarus americanus TaxID=6706 RepID=A0A8J5JY26_HOMAM|nr:putative Methyltransferase FkbM domain-containing protein 2 [Homarus americanus]
MAARVLLKEGSIAVFLLVILGIMVLEHQYGQVRSYLSSNSNTPNVVTTSSNDRVGEARAAIQSCRIESLQDIKQFFGYFDQDKYKCLNKKSFGGTESYGLNRLIKFTDGYKYVCLDPGVAPPPSHCLVYSFGINYEWSFDDAMGVYGCEVDRLGGIKDRLGHAGRRIDVLKMDIEKMEVEVLEEVLSHQPELLTSVTQFAIEIHPGAYKGQNLSDPTNIFQRFWRIFQQLKCLGFLLLHWNYNPAVSNRYWWQGSRQSTCYEIVWLRPPA